MIEFTREPIWGWRFLFHRSFTFYCFFNKINLFRISISLSLHVSKLCLLRNFPFHLDPWFHFSLFLKMEALCNWTSGSHSLLHNQGYRTFLVNIKHCQVGTKMAPMKHQFKAGMKKMNVRKEFKHSILKLSNTSKNYRN